jgi:hypothetical protein
VVADLNAKMAAEIATLKAQLESPVLDKERKRKESSSIEAANPKQLLQNMSNTTKEAGGDLSFFDILQICINHFNGCLFFEVLSVHRLGLMRVPMMEVQILR